MPSDSSFTEKILAAGFAILGRAPAAKALLLIVFLAAFPVVAEAATPQLFWTNWRDFALREYGRVQSDAFPCATNGVTLRERAADDFPFSIAVDPVGGKMYYAAFPGGAPRELRRANLDGSAVETIRTGIDPTFLIFDPLGNHLYFSDFTARSIRRINPDGSGLVEILDAGTVVTGVAVDIGNGKIYWAESENGRVLRANLNGTGTETLASELGGGSGVALDLVNSKLYWTVSDTGEVWQSNLDGSAATIIVDAADVDGDSNSPTIISVDAAGGKIYWIDNVADLVVRANLDGSGVETLVSHLDVPIGVSLDLTAGHLYATEVASATIRRFDLDGSNGLTLISVIHLPHGIAADFDAGKIYFTDRGAGVIRRMNVDGSDLEVIVASGQHSPRGIDTDLTNDKMYWVDTQLGRIQRADLDGGNIEDVVTGLLNPSDIDVDEVGAKIYWTDFGTDKIQRANLDGTGVEDLVTAGLEVPSPIAVDGPGGKVYWADNGELDRIQRSNLDGTDVETLIDKQLVLAAPGGLDLDLDAGKIYWSDFGYENIGRANLDGSQIEILVELAPPAQDIRGLILRPRPGLCPATPEIGCKTAGKTQFSFKQGEKPRKRKFDWKWKKGDEVLFSELGAPSIDGTSYQLCFYDAGGLFAEAKLPNGGPCFGAITTWEQKGDNAFKFRGKSGRPEGAQKGEVRSGEIGRTSASIKGGGEDTAVIDPLSVTPTVTVQLSASDGACWTSEFSAADISKQSAKAIKGKASNP